MYSTFVFGNFQNQNTEKKERHTYGASKDLLDGTNADNRLWYSKVRIHKAKLKVQVAERHNQYASLFFQLMTTTKYILLLLIPKP